LHLLLLHLLHLHLLHFLLLLLSHLLLLLLLLHLHLHRSGHNIVCGHLLLHLHLLLLCLACFHFGLMPNRVGLLPFRVDAAFVDCGGHDYEGDTPSFSPAPRQFIQSIPTGAAQLWQRRMAAQPARSHAPRVVAAAPGNGAQPQLSAFTLLLLLPRPFRSGAIAAFILRPKVLDANILAAKRCGGFLQPPRG
jgi:hypothetical protein